MINTIVAVSMLCGLEIHQGTIDQYNYAILAQYHGNAYILATTKDGSPYTFEDFRYVVFSGDPGCNIEIEDNGV